MNLIFKQTIDGLVYTTTVKHSEPPCSHYISIDGRQHPVVYQGLDVMSLSGNNPVTGLPTYFESNLLYFFDTLNESSIRAYCPSISEEDLLQALVGYKEVGKWAKVAAGLQKELNLAGVKEEDIAELRKRAIVTANFYNKDKTGEAIKKLRIWEIFGGQRLKDVQKALINAKEEAHIDKIIAEAKTEWQRRADQLNAIPDGTYWLTEAPEIDEESYWVSIDGGPEVICECGYGAEGSISVDTGDAEYLLFPDKEIAGAAARGYWEDMARNDSKEFACMVGEDTLIAWATGHEAGPGSTKVESLEEWLDLWLKVPMEHWASYDGTECSVEVSPKLEEDYGTFTVAYRIN